MRIDAALNVLSIQQTSFTVFAIKCEEQALQTIDIVQKRIFLPGLFLGFWLLPIPPIWLAERSRWMADWDKFRPRLAWGSLKN